MRCAREKASQSVFAAYLNVTPGLVSQWERGEKHPQGASLKLLSLVAKKGLGDCRLIEGRFRERSVLDSLPPSKSKPWAPNK